MKIISLTADVHFLYLLSEDGRVLRYEKQHPEKGWVEIPLPLEASVWEASNA